jgi:hypothetical protein
MQARHYAKLVEMMEAFLYQTDGSRDGYVYEQLADDMAYAAKLVYQACERGQAFAKQNEVSK